MTRNHIGVDLSKDWLDVFDPRRGAQRITSRAPEIRAWLAGLDGTDCLVFEATRGCDDAVMRACGARGLPFCRVNPLHAWHFARSLNLPKTDRIDARMLARFGAERGPSPTPPPDVARVELAELSARRDQLKRMETQEKNRLGKTLSEVVRQDIRTSLAALARRIPRAEARIKAFLAAHPGQAQQVRLLETIPGIGPVVSVTLISLMPELGTCDRRQIASLGGLAPRARESGKWRGARHIGDGRRHVRRLLYMAALTAMRGKLCPDFVETKRAEGRPGKLIAIAVARKLLTIANAVLRDQTPFKAPT